MPLVSYAVQIDLKCQACSAPVPIAGSTRKVRCPGCETEIALDGDFLEDALKDDIDHRAEFEHGGSFRVCNAICAEGFYRTSFGPEAPRCDNAACGREFSPSVIEEAVEDMDTLREISFDCPSCQSAAVIRRRPRPELMGHELARGLMLEHRTAPRLKGGGDIYVWCPDQDCGNAMALTEYTPNVTCDGCEATFALDRAQWDRFVALPGAKPFYVLVEESERAAVRRRGGPQKPFQPESFPVSRGWLSTQILLGPAFSGFIAVVLLRVALGGTPGANIMAAVPAGLLALLVLFRLPFLVHTLLFDSSIVLGERELHLPNLRFFQLRALDIPIADVAMIHAPRKSGGSSKIQLVRRSGGSYVFPAEFVDRFALMRAVEQRITPE